MSIYLTKFKEDSVFILLQLRSGENITFKISIQ